MSVLESMYNISFNVKRMTADTGRIDSLATVSSNNDGVLRPVTDRTKLFNEFHKGNEYKLWCKTSVDIQGNDLIVISGVDYGISDVTQYDDLEDDSESHIEVICYKK